MTVVVLDTDAASGLQKGPLTRAVAQSLVGATVALAVGEARRRGRAARPAPVNDMWVAACCLAADVQLVTYNRADFEDFRQYHGLRMLPADQQS